MTKAKIKIKVKRVKLAMDTPASVVTSATYVKKKLPWLAWKAIKKSRMKTRTRFGSSTALENRATHDMQIVHTTVPQTRIDLTEYL